MKDYEIIKVLECCVREDCKNCPYSNSEDDCMAMTTKALDLIKKQKELLDRPVDGSLNDKLCEVTIELERQNRYIADLQNELAYLRGVKATAEAFLGKGIKK